MREHFDLDPNILYLNSGTHSIVPRYVLGAVVRSLENYERNPTLQLMRIWPKLWRVQERLANFLRADARDLFLVPNVTYAMNQFILGARMQAGQEILLTNLEYGAVQRICRFRSERDGRRLRVVRLPVDPEELNRLGGEGIVKLLLESLRSDTGMLVVSEIFMANGLRLPLDLLAKGTRARGVQLVVDGAHSPGALALDFGALVDVDYYAGNLHKWMMGPKGTAFGWVSKHRQSELEPLMAGWTTFEAPPIFHSFGSGGDFALKFLNSACYDFSPFLGLAATLDFWEMQGEAAIRERIYKLQAYLEAKINAELGWQTLSPLAQFRGPLLSYALPDKWQESGQKNIFRLEREHQLVVGIPYLDGRWVIRLSPHIYNEEAELDRAVKILKISMA